MPAAGPGELGTALLIPGYTGSKEDFIAILGQLAAAGRRVVAIDLRGQYQTAGPDDPAAYDLAELGADVTAVATRRGRAPARPLLRRARGARGRSSAATPPTSLTLLSSGPAALPGPRAQRTAPPPELPRRRRARDLKGKVAELWHGSSGRRR